MIPPKRKEDTTPNGETEYKSTIDINLVVEKGGAGATESSIGANEMDTNMDINAKRTKVLGSAKFNKNCPSKTPNI